MGSRIVVIGAGSMGGLYGGRLAQAGMDVTFVDQWQQHVDAINASGLRLSGLRGESSVKARASVSAGGLPPFDIAIVLVDTNSTAAAAAAASSCLKSDGYAISLQNGIGNVEILESALGRARVVGGLSYHSASLVGPGHVAHTNIGKTLIGELDGGQSPRVEALRKAFELAEMNPVVSDDVLAEIWRKFALNAAINPICAVTGLRVGEISRTPAVDALQTRILEEIIAVMDAKGVRRAGDLMASIKAHMRNRFIKPSMMQHVEAGRRTEIDALNGALVKQARELNILTPYNDALVALVKGVERSRQQVVHDPIDYDALDAAAAAQEKAETQ